MATLPYWNNGEVISSDKLNSMVASIIAGDPLAVKVSNATKNDVNQIVGYLSSLHDKAKTNLNSATSTGAFDTAYTNMTALVSNKLGAYANDDTVDLYSTGIRASIITFIQAYDTMMSSDRLNNKNDDNALGRRIDLEATDRETADDALDTKIFKIQANGGGRNLLRKSTNSGYKFQPNLSRIDNYIIYQASTVYMIQGQQYTVHADASNGLVWSGTHNPNVESNNVVLRLTNKKDISPIISDANTGTGTTFTWNHPSGTYWLRVNTYKVDNSGYVDKVMLEKGIVAHDWTLAPEDTNSAIENVKAKADANTASIIKITSDGGGINLWVGSKSLQATSQNAPSVDWNTDSDGIRTAHITGSNTGSGLYGMWKQIYANSIDPFTIGDSETFSVEMKGTGTITIGRENDFTKVVTLTDTWTRYSVSGEVKHANGAHVMYNNSGKDCDAYVRLPMVERGIIVHDWSPAPQDVQSQIDNLNANKISSSDVNWNLVANNSSNTYRYASGSTINLPNNSSITINGDRITSHIYLPTYLTDYTPNTDFNVLATSGECDNLFVSSATMANLTNRPTNPDTGAFLTGDCFYTCHYAYSGTTVRAFQKIYSCDYNYTFTRSYNGSSGSWTNWSCLTPYA